MRTSKIKPGLAALLVLASLLFLTCRAKSPVEDVKLIVNVEASPVIITGVFVNAVTGDPIGFDGGEGVEATITGPDKSKVVSLDGEAKTTFAAGDGFVSFAVDENIIPQLSSPIDITVVAKADGYLTSSTRVLVGKPGGHAFTLPMIKLNDPPEGVNLILDSGGQTDATGKVINTVHVQTAPDARTQAIGSITIPAGAVIKDDNGTPLTGPLTTRLIYFNNVSEPALQSFPGGFSVRISENENGNAEDAFFTTGGFLAVEVSDNSGRQAKTFSVPITVSAQIPGGTVNPKTGQPIKNGDKIGIWSYNEETGAWKYEAEGTASEPDANGNLTITLQTNHLTFWNMDWKGPECAVGAVVNIVGKNPDECLFVKMIKLSTGEYIDHLDVCEDIIEFVRVPPDMPVRLEAYDDCDNLRGTVDIGNLCANQAFVLDVTPPPPNNTTLRVKLTGVCSNQPMMQFRPTMPVWYWDQSGCRWFYAGLMRQGRITITGLNVPGSYVFAVVYNEVLYWGVVQIRADYSVYVPTVGQVYNPEFEKGTLSYTVELPLDFCVGP